MTQDSSAVFIFLFLDHVRQLQLIYVQTSSTADQVTSPAETRESVRSTRTVT